MHTTRVHGSPGSHISSPPPGELIRDHQACVLVAEDHSATRFLLRTILELRGISVVEAENGEMATALATNVRTDMIIMETNLPFLDGYAATSRLRTNPATHTLTIVLISAHPESSARVKAFAAGCNEYLVKPFRLSDVNRLLDRYLLNESIVKTHSDSPRGAL